MNFTGKITLYGFNLAPQMNFLAKQMSHSVQVNLKIRDKFQTTPIKTKCSHLTVYDTLLTLPLIL